MPAVEAGWRHDDLDVRRRCEEVLTRLHAAVCAERVKALRAGRAVPDAPLWGHYRRMLGGGRAAVALFADLYQSESDLLEEVAAALRRGERGEVERHLRQRVRLLAAALADQTAGESPDPGSLRDEFPHRVCAALLLAALPGVDLGDEGWEALAGALLRTVSFSQAAAGRAEVRELLGWAYVAARGEASLPHAL